MTLEQQRIKIAKFCGWTHIQERPYQSVGLPPNGELLIPLPNYCTSLDSFRSAALKLSKEEVKLPNGYYHFSQQRRYIHLLFLYCGNAEDAIDAPIELRVKALLKVITNE